MEECPYSIEVKQKNHCLLPVFDKWLVLTDETNLKTSDRLNPQIKYNYSDENEDDIAEHPRVTLEIKITSEFRL